MSHANALIVDDSKTAQFRLAKHLKVYDLNIDLVESAESALTYLKQSIPDVIFLDHHMEGMDGLEALKIIKDNPDTATIPVIMYTADRGDVYAGQAHALGALDILSKEILHPSTVESVLAKLNIHPIREPVDHVPPYSVLPRKRDKVSNENIVETNELKREELEKITLSVSELNLQVERIVKLHTADIRAQISDSTQSLFLSLSDEVKRLVDTIPKEAPEVVNPPPLSVLTEEVEAKASRMGFVSNMMLVFILTALALIGYQLFETTINLKQIKKDNAQLQANFAASNQKNITSINSEAAPAPQLKQQAPQLTPGDARLQNLNANLINWLVNTNFSFAYDEHPLNDKQIEKFQNLIEQLQLIDFRGLIEIDINLGNYCLTKTTGDEWQIAPPNTPLGSCNFAKQVAENDDERDYFSPEYIQFERTAKPIIDGEIDLLITVSEYHSPPTDYPEVSTLQTASQWNEIAEQNNRVLVKISPFN